MTSASHIWLDDYAQDQDIVQLALASAQVGIWDWDLVTGLMRWNREHEQLFGLPPHSFDGTYATFDRHLHPADRAGLNQAIQQAIQGHTSYRYEFRIVWADGSIHWLEGRGNPIFAETGQPLRMIGTVMAIDERKQAQLLRQQQFEQQQLVLEVTRQIRQSFDLPIILQTTVDEVRQFLAVDRVIIMQFSPTWGGTVTVEAVRDEALAILPFNIHDPCIGDSYVEPFKQGLVTAKADIYTADISPCHVAFLAQFQVRANLVVPILKNDELWGLLAVHHCTAPRLWQDTEIDLLRQIAAQVSIALQQATLFKQVQTELIERQQAEAALREHSALLRLFAQSAPAGIAMFDRDMRYVMASQRWVDEYQLDSVAALINRSHYEIFPEIPASWRQIHQRCLAGAIEKCDEDLWVRADGTQQWISWEIQPWYTAAGEIGGIIIFSIDITPQKQAEIDLQHLNEALENRIAARTIELTNINDRLLAVLKEQTQTEAALQQQTRQEQLRWHVTQAIRQYLDLNTILNTAVAEARQTLQADRVAVYRFWPDWSGDFIVESVGSAWVKLVEPDQPQVWEDTHLQDTQGGRFQNHETFVVADIYAAGLHHCHIELLEQFQAKAYAVAPIFSGTTLWGLLAIYQNATPRCWQAWEIELLEQIASQLAIAIQQSELYRQLQVELQERQQATAIIREAERRWRSLLDNVQLIVVGLDQAGTINYVNPFFLSLTGYTDAEVRGQNWFANFLPPHRRSSRSSVSAAGCTPTAHPHHQNTILTKAGEERYIAWNNTLLQDAQGTTIGTISIGEDITERQKIEKMKNEFIAIVSHELRTPLTSIRGSLGLLATGVLDDDPVETKRMVEIAAIDTERLVRLVNDVLDLEKLESGKVAFVPEWCNVAELMQQSLAVMQNSAQAAGVELVSQPLSQPIWGVPDRIIQTFTNLLSNAIKFSPSGSTVTLTAEIMTADRQLLPHVTAQPTAHILFTIHDQGRGIPAEQLESIFGRFHQVDASDSRDKGGTGLGLAICQSIVHQHNGHIWAESTWGQGSTFFFTLPLPTA
jgi:PAS domain S-box-containing protein